MPLARRRISSLDRSIRKKGVDSSLTVNLTVKISGFTARENLPSLDGKHELLASVRTKPRRRCRREVSTRANPGFDDVRRPPSPTTSTDSGQLQVTATRPAGLRSSLAARQPLHVVHRDAAAFHLQQPGCRQFMQQAREVLGRQVSEAIGPPLPQIVPKKHLADTGATWQGGTRRR